MTDRIVVTGLGAFSPLGATADETWRALLAKESGIRPFTGDWVAEHDLPVTFGAQVKADPADFLKRPEMKRLDPSSQYALISAREAWQDAGAPAVEPERLAVSWGTGIGGVWTLISSWEQLRQHGARRVMPMTVPMLMPNAPGAAVGMDIEARSGVRTVVSACASSTESIVGALQMIRDGLADVVVAGGSEAAIHPLPIAAFAQMQALSRRNDDPAHASRPYDRDRDGFVIGEGAAALVLETEAHAKARGAKIYAVLAGGAVTNDSYHITAPEPEGLGASRAVEQALAEAGLKIDDIVHINAHATSTPVGDGAEIRAFRRVLGDHVDHIAVSATKSATGHLLGGAGALEAVFTVKALHERIAPPTLNLENPDPEIELDVVTEPRPLPAGEISALSTSFGFGGHNAVIAVTSYEG